LSFLNFHCHSRARANPSEWIFTFVGMTCRILWCFFSLTTALFANQPRSLTLEDAVFLAIRENPNVIAAEITQVIQKYTVELEAWKFKPHYTLSGTVTTTRNFSTTENGFVTQNATGVDWSVSLLTPYGTQVTFSPSVNQSDHFHPGLSLEVSQPLLRGFGRAIVETEFNNALDNEKISRLNLENVLRVTVTNVINAYVDVISAQKKLTVDEDALKRALISVEQTKKFIRSGRKAGVELVTVEADAASAQMNIENDKNALLSARFALLGAIGLDPESKIAFQKMDIPALIKKYNIPPLSQAKIFALENDIQYQTDKLTLEGAKKRSLLQAKDNMRWKLDLSGSISSGKGVGGGQNSGLESIVNGVNQTSEVALNLTVPIDDRAAKVAFATAKMNLRQAEIALQQERWVKETNIINGWNSLYSARRALRFAEDASILQQKTYQISFQKYAHGLIDSLQLQSAQQQLINSELGLNVARMGYLKALINEDLLMGHTLKTWGITMRKNNYGK